MGRPKVAERLTGVGGHDESLLLGLQALADPVRLRMVRLLAEREQCVCHLTAALGLSQASVSHHVAILKRAGLVADRRDTRWTYYRLAPGATSSLRRSVDELLESTPTQLAPVVCCDPPASLLRELPTFSRSPTALTEAPEAPGQTPSGQTPPGVEIHTTKRGATGVRSNPPSAG